MNRPFLSLAFACVAASAVLAQTSVPVGVDLFGDDIVQPLTVREQGRFATLSYDGVQKRVVLDAYRHALIFQDGRQLCGRLMELTQKEVVWERADADTKLRFPRSGVRRIITGDPLLLPETGRTAQAGEKNSGPMPATVKLPGSDWLFGDIRTDDGAEFTLTLANGSLLRFPREKVEWLSFGTTPAPAFGFSGDAMSMEGWLLNNTGGAPEVAEGVIKFKGTGWIGRQLASAMRIEVDFELPEGAPTTRLWLQPYSPSPNSYSTGTVELSFGERELGRLVFFNVFERQTTPIPKDDVKGPTRFRVFYDAPGNRLIVTRNGATLGEWKLKETVDGEVVSKDDLRGIRGLCFDTQQSGGMSFRRLRVRPWDGLLPDQDKLTEDRAVMPAAGSKSGKLEEISETHVQFAGMKAPREAGIFVRLPNEAPGPADAAALLVFNGQGELAATDLRIEGNQIHARTSIDPAFKAPTSEIQMIVLGQTAVEKTEDLEVLVFRNGDTLVGTLLEAAHDSSIRWRLATGQEVLFQPALLAGVHFARRDEPKATGGSLAELVNGDRVAGKLISFDAEGLRLDNPILGERLMRVPLLHKLHPNPKGRVLEAGADPYAWTGARPIARQGLVVGPRVTVSKTASVFLDGVFLASFGPRGARNHAGLSRYFDDPPERYEFRCEVTDAGYRDPTFSMVVSGRNSSPTVQISLSNGRLRVYGYNMPNRRGGVVGNDRDVSITSKIREHKTRRELRMFVDRTLGTIDFLIDGVHVSKFGRQNAERAPGLGSQVSLSATATGENGTVISNVSVSPWNGELPRFGECPAGVALTNGDAASGTIGQMRDGKLEVGSGDDAIAIPLERIVTVDFGNAAAPGKAKGRVRLIDGSVADLDEFHYAANGLKARSAVLGEFEVKAPEVAELIFSPSPRRFPRLSEPQKIAEEARVEGEKR